MFKRICKLLSAVLVFALLLQMLPLQTLATNYRAGLSEKIDLPTISATDKVTVAIQDEVPAKRTAFSKEYKAGGGQNMVAVYPVAVHYETPTGWEEIDNTLKLTEGSYINTAGIWQVALPQQLTKDNRISISKDGYTLQFGMSGELRLDDSVAVMSADAEPATKVEPMQASQAQVSPKKLLAADTPTHMAILSQKNHSRLTYAEVYENTNVIYDLQGNKVKESIVMEAYDSDLVGYRYILEVGTLNPVLNEDGSIDFYDADNKNIVMVMEAPFLLDANAEQSNDVRVTLTGKDGTYYLTYTLPRQWLAQEERAWPVILDPAVVPSVRYHNIQDKTVGDVKDSSANWAINEVGYYAPRGVERFYLRFNDIPALTSADVILRAEIEMYKPYGSSVEAPIEVHKVMTNWRESAITWANKPAIDDTVEDYQIVQAAGNYTWDVTDIARGWYAGENTGMLFKASAEVEQARQTNWKQFHASDMADETIILTVYYRNNNGLESYWDYSSFSAGRAGTGYVNNHTGNLVWTRADLGFGGTRAAVAISHIYNANDAASNQFGMGYGWRTNYNQRVYQWSLNSNYYVWEDGDGTKHYFYNVSTGTYKDEDGLELELKTTGSGNSKYTITDKGGNVSHFDTKGRLTQITNNQETPSPVTITYTTTSGYLINAVTDAIGRRYVFTYTDGLLTKIEAQNSTQQHLTQVTYGYTDSLLTSITDKDGEFVTYTYNSEKLLTEAQDIASYRLAVSYNTTAEGAVRRVATVCEFDGEGETAVAGGELTFTYAQNQTTIEDYSGNKTVYQFNNWGNTTSIQDGEGRAQFAQYATDVNPALKKGNQLTAASKLQNTVTNLFADSSFENDTLWEQYLDDAGGFITTEDAYHGSKSMKLAYSINYAAVRSADFTIEPGETYTFSAYIKRLVFTAEIGISGPLAVSVQVPTPGNEWQRVEVSYTNTTDQPHTVYAYIYTSGRIYVDCVQLEKSPTASRYNLIDNGDFTAASGWTDTGLATGDGISAPAEAASWLTGNAYKIIGNPNTAKSVSQTVEVSGNKDDTFVLAGWAQGNAVPLTENSGRTFALKAVFHYTDGTDSDPMTVSFNPDTPYWQYAAVPLVAKQAYNSITVTLQYEYGMNTVYFDGIGLYKEQFSSSYEYDANGNVISVTDLQKKETRYNYENNDLTEEILPDGLVMTYDYDAYHNVEIATSSTGLVYTFDYDEYGNNTSVSIEKGGRELVSSATYSDNGNALTKTTDTVGNETTYQYNPDTNVLEWVRYPEDDEYNKTAYTYDEMYRTIKTAVGEIYTPNEVIYTYTDDLLTKITTKTTEYTFNYGDFDLRTSVQIGTKTLASYEYEDRTQRLTKLLYGNNDFIQYTYDDQGRVTKDTYEDGDTVSYLYDNSGALASVIDSGSSITTTYYYDFIDRLAKYTEKGTNYSHSVEHVYDAKNNLSTLKETINGTTRTTGYTYDADNRLQTVTGNGQTVVYTYDDFGRVEKQEVKNGTETVLTTEYTYYDPEENKTSVQVKSIEYTADNYSITYTYTYDGNGNILTIYDGTNTIRYSYTESNQLYSEDDPTGVERSFRYTDADQVFVELVYEDGVENVIEYIWDATWGDMLTDYGNISLSYDAIGNMLNDGTYTYTWEHGRELAEMASGDGRWSFTYDANGMRTSKTRRNVFTDELIDTYSYVYNGSQLSQMTKNGQVLNFFYDGEGRPAYFTYGSATYYYVTNLQGDVIAILDSTGTMVVNYHYDAYGVLLQTGGTMAATLGTLNPLTYRGYVYDHETGLYYLQSRYYNPVIKRFISADGQLASVGGDVNGYDLFEYCFNNPVNMHDSSGNWPNWLKKIAAAAATVVVAAVTVAAVVAAAPAAACTLTLAAMSVGASYAVASTVATAVVVTTAVAATAYAVDTAYTAVTGKSVLLDTVFNGNEDAYNAGAQVVAIATAGMVNAAAISPGVCFVEGTLVLAASGHVAIEKIEAGDLVWAENPETGEKELKEIVQTFVNETTELIHLQVGDEEIITTPEHPFYMPVKGWTAACKLRAGDILALHNGKYVIVEKVQHEILEAPITVYNFEVADFHTYYVGRNSVLVHNDCKPDSPVKVSEKSLKGVDVHAFKKEFVGNSVARWDIYKDKANDSVLWLGNKTQTVWQNTGYSQKELLEIFPK